MLDPISFWLRVLDSWQTIATTQRQMVQTGLASEIVIASRSRTIADAVNRPWSADHAELARMVPEKVEAFTLSGNAVIDRLLSMQADYLKQVGHAGAMMARGRAPTFGEWFSWSSRTAAYTVRTFEQSARIGRDAIAPIHDKVTTNARRLAS